MNKLSATELKQQLINKLSHHFGITPEEASDDQMYKALLLSIRDILSEKNSEFERNIKKTSEKKVYYMCMEFLIGPSLKNNLVNLGIEDKFRKILKDYGFSLDKMFRTEADPGLGNGGLGRLAACFMDSLASLDYPAYGFSICYEYGLFKQKIIDGEQVEFPDIWMPTGEPWLVPRADKTYTVKFGGYVEEKWTGRQLEIEHKDYNEIDAVPYDMMISGYDSKAVNILRLWKAKDSKKFDMKLFSQGEYVKAVEENTNAETISKVLYPADNHEEGKLLRLSQQYFLVSASLQCILNDHLAQYGTLENLADKVAIHINDTHPALCIPELMRILMDECSYTWDRAWEITTATISYTNHTVMPEALEKWHEGLFKYKLPRIYSIICEINRRFCDSIWQMYPGDWNRISRMSILEQNQVKMANLSVAGSHIVNGVSKLHSDILKDTVFHDFYQINPDKFTNVTNGIAHRRWLCSSNPLLSALLDECIGSSYKKNPETLINFLKYKDDKSVLNRLDEIKKQNKQRLAKHVFDTQKVKLDCDSIFDIQIKRMHEYKRQLLNVLRIIYLYTTLKENPNLDMAPQTFIFSAKAAPSYYMAKETIKLISYISMDIEKNPKIKEKLKVVFLENYNVSLAEILIPSADISEQISLAGKEASGTGNMKLMINGAVTIGTYDGANVEMFDTVGADNFYLFGMSTEEVNELWKIGYHSADFYNRNDKLKKIVDALDTGFNGHSFSFFTNYLLYGSGVSDPYMCFADFASYYNVHRNMINDYADRNKWLNMSLVNIASAGRFAADRSIREYADNIWHIKQVNN